MNVRQLLNRTGKNGINSEQVLWSIQRKYSVVCKPNNKCIYEGNDYEKVDINVLNEGLTTLMIISENSAEYGLKDMKLLLAPRESSSTMGGADPDIQDGDGYTALMYASKNSNYTSSEETAKILIEAGANVNLLNEDGYTALMLVSESEVIQCSNEMVKMLIDAGTDVNIQGNDGNTALMLAFEYGSFGDIVEMLIEAGTDLALRNCRGETALIKACSPCGDETRSDENVKMLIKIGSDINAQNDWGLTPLMLISDYTIDGDSEIIVKILLDAGADPNIHDKEGNTALMYASRNDEYESSREIVKMLTAPRESSKRT